MKMMLGGGRGGTHCKEWDEVLFCCIWWTRWREILRPLEAEYKGVRMHFDGDRLGEVGNFAS